MFGNLLKGVANIAVGIVATPATVAVDLITLGGAMSDRDEPYTVSALKKVGTGIEQVLEEDLS